MTDTRIQVAEASAPPAAASGGNIPIATVTNVTVWDGTSTGIPFIPMHIVSRVGATMTGSSQPPSSGIRRVVSRMAAPRERSGWFAPASPRVSSEAERALDEVAETAEKPKEQRSWFDWDKKRNHPIHVILRLFAFPMYCLGAALHFGTLPLYLACCIGLFISLIAMLVLQFAWSIIACALYVVASFVTCFDERLHYDNDLFFFAPVNGWLQAVTYTFPTDDN
eukprot:g3284.t1